MNCYSYLLVVFSVAARSFNFYIFVHTSSHWVVVAFQSNSKSWICREYQQGLGRAISWIDCLKMESNGIDTVEEVMKQVKQRQAFAISDQTICSVAFPQLLRNLGILWKRTAISNQADMTDDLLSHHVTSWLRMKIWQKNI